MMQAWKQWEGQVVNHAFVLGPFLGSSEHSAVFLTEYGEPQLQRAVVKLIPIDPNTAAVQLSRLESAAKLAHPCLIRLFDWGLWRKEDLALLYVVMEYAAEDLSQVLPQRPLTPAEAREVLTSSLDALAYIHKEGFVHGHLKPANILAVGDHVKISSDLLCPIGDSARVFGNPSVYDPPEASRGEILPAGDVWALALTMVQVLTQELPATEGMPDLEQVLPERLPEPFLDITRHCLQEDPRRRWTVNWVRARLKPEDSSLSPLPGGTEQLWGLKVPRYAMWLATISLILAALLIGSSLLHRRSAAQAATSAHVQPAGSQPTRNLPVRLEPKPNRMQAIEVERPLPFGSQAGARNRPAPVVSETAGASEPRPSAGSSSADRADGVIHQVLPDVPAKARSTIQGKVKVGLVAQVDSAGNVVGVNLESPGTSRYFADLALQAARGWKFAAARPDGLGVASRWALRFEFRRTETEVHAVRLSERTQRAE